MTQDIFSIFNIVRIFTVVMLAFFVNLVLTYFWTKILYKYFKPGKEIEKANAPIFNSLHKRKEGTPTMGGLTIWLTTVVIAFIFWFFSETMNGFWSRMNFLSRAQTWVPIGSLVLAGLVGMADDMFGIFRRKGFSIKQRLALFMIVAILGAWWFYYKLDFNSINIPFLGDFSIGIWYFFFFILIVVATAFSADITDGLDGLSGGIFLTIFAAQAVIAFDQGRMDLVAMLGVIIGALVGFLWYNIYPAKFFMGDTGVMALGFVVGIVALLTNTVFLLPLFAIIFVLEAISDIIQMLSKKIRKKKVFLSAPIHHHFEALGWPETQVTMRFWMINAIGAVLGLIIFLVDSKIPPISLF
jgi:phospho-N-acetylmuramoyl-pentapeptide-transferase